jgi:hypothetical protein
VTHAAERQLTNGWTLSSGADACTLYRTRNGQFVFLVIRSDRTAMVRIHDKRWHLQPEQSVYVDLERGGATQALPGTQAQTSNGWNGIVASVGPPMIGSLTAADRVTVASNREVQGIVHLDGLNDGIAALRDCADRLAPGTSHVVQSPTPTSDLSLQLGDLNLAEVPKHPLAFRIAVDERGNATSCTIVESSGSVVADERACAALLQRAHFKPAVSDAGVPISSTYETGIAFKR